MMPLLAIIGVSGPRWLPPVPVPLFLLWPLVPVCLMIARLLDGGQPGEAAKLRTVVMVFRDLRGLTIDTKPAGGNRVRLRFI